MQYSQKCSDKMDRLDNLVIIKETYFFLEMYWFLSIQLGVFYLACFFKLKIWEDVALSEFSLQLSIDPCSQFNDQVQHINSIESDLT